MNGTGERTAVRPRRRRGRALLATGLAGALAAAAAAWTARGIDAAGAAYQATGQGVVTALAEVAAALRDGDPAALAALLDPAYDARPLGLASPRLLTAEDGVRRYRFAPGRGRLGRAAAAAEWAAWRAGLSAVESVELHLERLDRWEGDEVAAVARFAAIGRPRGETRSGVDRGRLALRLRRAPGDGFRILAARLLAGERTIASRASFTDVAAVAGLDFTNRFYPRFLDRPLRFAMLRFGPAGITAADYDGDGWIDLFVPDGVESRLFRNRGDGGFDDVTAAAGLTGLSGVSVALFADHDNDGDRDLFVSRTFEPNQLFANRGDGTFRDVTARSGLGEDCCTTVASWGDVDGDGDLDLYLGRYLDPRRESPAGFYTRNGEPNQLYRNDGDGRFTNVTRAAGVGEPGLCLGTVFGDYDDDGDPDLYVVNDFGRKTLYRNAGDGTFRDVTVESGTLAYGAGMSASFGDYDNDGRLDLYVAHIRSDHPWFAAAPTVRRFVLGALTQGVAWGDLPLFLEVVGQSGLDLVGVFRQMASGNTLLRNRGDGTFADVSAAAGANPPGWFWGSAFADLDNDGWQDIYSANGWVYGEPGTDLELDFLGRVITEQRRVKSGELFDPAWFAGRSWHGWERNRHLRNEGDGTFTEIGRAAGSDLTLNSRGVAVADFWHRGVLDLAVAASTDRHALLRNEGRPRRHWLSVELVGGAVDLADGANRDAVGARVTVRAGGLEQLREVVLGDGYGSQSDLRAHFGLGGAAVVEELTVRWPRSGRVQRFQDVPADRFLRVVEGRDVLVEVAPAPPAPRIPAPPELQGRRGPLTAGGEAPGAAAPGGR